MGGVGLELSRELLPSACTGASLFFSADIRQPPLAGQELRAARLSQGGGGLGFLDAEHHQQFVFYLLHSDKLFQNKVIHHNVHLLPVVYNVYCMQQSQH